MHLKMIDENSVEKVVYLSKGGLSISTTIFTGSGIVDQHEHKIFGDKEGWHWVEHIVIDKQPKLDKDIFLKLLVVNWVMEYNIVKKVKFS